jgi:hypothetical protein
LDKHPYLLILPIMDKGTLKLWNGGMYHAIVIAGNYNNYSAASVYDSIDAGSNMMDEEGNIIDDCLANDEECEKARSVLETMVLYVCKSFVDQGENVNVILEKYGIMVDEGRGFVTTTLDKHRKKTVIVGQKATYDSSKQDEADDYYVLVPSKISTNTDIQKNVRKILFDNSKNPIPDPVLLLAKSTSNWLKRQSLFILPGCDSDSSSDSVASEHAEAVMRGWLPNDSMKLCVGGYVEIHPSSTFDESLSDDEDYK